MRRDFRCAVIGAGGIGSAAAYWLSRTVGEDVVCLEQFHLGHGLGASEDHSRIIRRGYHATRYTALTDASYAAWREVEAASGVPLVRVTGMLNVAPADAAVLAEYAEAMDAHGAWLASAPELVRFASSLNDPEHCPILKADTIRINSGWTVKDVSEYMGVPVPEIIKKLMSLGEMAMVTQTLADETIEILAEEFGKDIEIVEIPEQKVESLADNRVVVHDEAASTRGHEATILRGGVRVNLCETRI